MNARQASCYLNTTDWYIIRFIETGVPVPAEVTANRAIARESLSKMEVK